MRLRAALGPETQDAKDGRMLRPSFRQVDGMCARLSHNHCVLSPRLRFMSMSMKS